MSEREPPRSPLRVSPESTLGISKAARTRASILNSALDFVWSRPFREMTVSSVMAGTEVGRSAFYQHFTDLHEVMETLLKILQDDLFEVAHPWFTGFGDPAALLQKTITGMVNVCHDRGPMLRAVTDAATSDERFESDWNRFMEGFDDAVTDRIEADQAQGLTANFPARPVAIGLNRLDAYMLIHAFGQHPRSPENPVTEALVRIWVSTLYGPDQLSESPPPLVRT